MTKEEIIKHLHEALNFVDITFPYRYVLVEAIEALSQPSLPSNLDEAAGAYAYEYTVNDNGNGGDDWEDDIKRTFIAAVGWLAEQGWHEEAVIKGSDDVVWLNYNVELPIDLAKYFKDGDKVVVQIRKK